MTTTTESLCSCSRFPKHQKGFGQWSKETCVKRIKVIKFQVTQQADGHRRGLQEDTDTETAWQQGGRDLELGGQDLELRGQGLELGQQDLELGGQDLEL